jgi:hypothetical protein
MGEFSNFLVFNLGEESHPNSPEFIFLSALQFVHNYSFQQTRRHVKSHRIWTVDWMKESKYQLESCGCPLPFWYSTLSQISDRTTSDLNLLAAAHSQGRFNVDTKNVCLDALSWDGAWLFPVVLLESMHLFIILLPAVRSFSPIKFSIKILSKFVLDGRFLFLWTLRAPSSNLGWVTIWSSHSDVVFGITHSCLIH